MSDEFRGAEIKQLEEKFTKQLAELSQSKNPVSHATETGQKSVEPSQPERQKGTRFKKRKKVRIWYAVVVGKLVTLGETVTNLPGTAEGPRS